MEVTTPNRSGHATERSAPVITIFASPPVGEENIDKDSIPCVIIEHVGTVPTSTSSAQSAQNTTDSVHKCEDCDYSSHNKHYLKQHIDLVHNPERPYKCPFCDYAGKRSHSLREHLVVHTNERPYECEHCNASFRKKGHLTNHIKLHTNHYLIKCSLCTAYLADQETFEKHLKDMHKTDKIFACELCDFVAGEQSVMVKHIQTHDKVFKCSECAFVTADVNKLASHAESHTQVAKSVKTTQPVSTPATLSQQALHPAHSATEGVDKAKQPLMLKCTECGFTAPTTEAMKSHMWSHITRGEKGEIECKTQEVTAVGQSAPKEIRVIEAILPDNAAYKCTECSFVHKEATVFIKHMLTHRVKTEKIDPDPIPKHEDQNVPRQNQRLGQNYIVAPVSKENTCTNAENTPFTHDPATGRFRCIICGYSCEYQRTIKAHIWKHSGNKAIDYPMFQNGPLSMYDDLPTAKSLVKVEDPALEIVEKSIPVAAHEEVKVSMNLGFSVEKTLVEPTQNPVPQSATTPVTHVRSVSENTVTNIKLVKTKLAPKTVEGGTTICQMQTVDGKTLALVRETAQKSVPETGASVLPLVSKIENEAPLPITEETVVTVEKIDVGDKTSESQVSKNSQHPLTSPSKNAKPVILAKPKTSPTINKDQETLSKAKTDSPKKEKSDEGDVNMMQIADGIWFDKAPDVKTEEVCVVVETVDSVPTAGGFTGMKSQQNSPRVQDQTQLDDLADGNTSTSTSPAAETKSPPSMVTRARSRQALKAAKEKSQKEIETIQAKQLAELEKAAREEEALKKAARSDSLAKKHCEEAVTLLSLLRKSPNINSVAALEAVGNGVVGDKDVRAYSRVEIETDSEDELISGEVSESTKPKTGICSSLLAVIEQLRERSKSESETDESFNAKNLSRRQNKRKGRRESVEDDFSLDSIENMEKIIEDGETKYRCKLCHYSNSRTLLIRLHMRLHKSKKPFECSLCDFIAGSSEDLQEHMIRHCKMRTYPCKLCPSTFNYKSQLRAHMRAHSDKDPLVCHMCEFETNDPITYRNHLRFHADQYYHKCDLCNKLFVTKLELRSHKQELCYKDQPESIDDSDGTDSDYELQREVNVNKENLKCSQCEFTTTSVAVFSDHARIHEETKTLKCELCDFTAVSSRSLKSHMKRHINDQRYVQQPLEQYKCNLCGYVCHHLPSLKSHMWRHASDRNYSYEFTNDVINAAIDYDCRIDSSNTSDPDLLEKVLDSEKKILEGRLNNSLGPDGQQPVCWVVFKCCQCGFETINKAQLNVHMRSHSDIIQRTLEVSQGLARPIVGLKRSAIDKLQGEAQSESKLFKTQDHG